MSELKAVELGEAYKVFDDDKEFYLKSEADEAIEEKDKEIAELKKRLKNTISAASITCGAVSRCNAELRHSNYKRCLAMAKWCEAMCGHYLSYEEPKWFWYRKWGKRWLELAEKFKEEK